MILWPIWHSVGHVNQLPAWRSAVPDLNTLLDDHVLLAYESADRIFLNGYVARLQEPDQLGWFLC